MKWRRYLLEQHPELSIPRFHVIADHPPMTDEAIGQFDRGLHHLIERHGAIELQRARHGVHHGRNGAAHRAIARDHAKLREFVGRGERRRYGSSISS